VVPLELLWRSGTEKGLEEQCMAPEELQPKKPILGCTRGSEGF